MSLAIAACPLSFPFQTFLGPIAAEIPSGAGIIAPRHPAVLHDVI